MQTCTSCQEEKPESEFYIRKDKCRKKFTSHCKQCKRSAALIKRQKNRNGKNKGCLYYKNNEKLNEDSLLSWYIAGLFAADGNINNNKFSITMHPRDIDTIILVKDFFEFNGPIKYYKNYYPYVAIGGSEQIVKCFREKFNITEKKTLTLMPPKDFPSLDHALSYIIGYIDGDGCIYKTDRLCQLQILGTKEILDFFISIFNFFDNVDISPRKSSTPSPVIKQICISANPHGKYSNLIKKMLSIEVPKMERKWGKLRF